MAEAIRVLIADDQVQLRESFRLLIDSTPGMTVVGEAGDGAMAVAHTREMEPDVVLMDLRMPVMDGITATRTICADQAMRSVRILVLTMFDMDDYVYPALQAGASGFILKGIAPGDLITGIRAIATGNGLLAPTITRRLVANFARPRETLRPTFGLARLTNREREVLVLVSKGMSNAEISDSLVISLATVKTHVSSLLAKLSARDRAQLVMVAYESGITERGTSR